MIFDNRPCDLGEGPLWHPTRNQLFWFDILNNRMLSRTERGPREWQFTERVSAAGWVNDSELLIASETQLFRYNVDNSAKLRVASLEADKPENRSNDGRADPRGGFWIGTMGKKAERGAGAIYRYYRRELRKLFDGLSIPNSICFSPDGRTAYFSDTVTSQLMRVAINREGWPEGEPQVFLDLTAEGLNPDGAVVDAKGLIWLAQWGAARVVSYAPDGELRGTFPIPAPHSSCPAFGGEDLTTLYCTSALQDMDLAAIAQYPNAGMTFAFPHIAKGKPEPQVIL